MLHRNMVMENYGLFMDSSVIEGCFVRQRHV